MEWSKVFLGKPSQSADQEILRLVWNFKVRSYRSLLCFDTVWSCGRIPTFRTTWLPPSLGRSFRKTQQLDLILSQ